MFTVIVRNENEVRRVLSNEDALKALAIGVEGIGVMDAAPGDDPMAAAMAAISLAMLLPTDNHIPLAGVVLSAMFISTENPLPIIAQAISQLTHGHDLVGLVGPGMIQLATHESCLVEEPKGDTH